MPIIVAHVSKTYPISGKCLLTYICKGYALPESKVLVLWTFDVMAHQVEGKKNKQKDNTSYMFAASQFSTKRWL